MRSSWSGLSAGASATTRATCSAKRAARNSRRALMRSGSFADRDLLRAATFARGVR